MATASSIERPETGSSRFLRDLRGAAAFGFIGPNWFASVMGTGILAVALVTLPVPVPGRMPIAAGVWLLAGTLLAAVTAATALHHRAAPGAARGHVDDPVLAHFYGAPAMAMMTVGAGALLVGGQVIGNGAALALDVVLWSLGTALGLVTTVVVPYRILVVQRVPADEAVGAWLMPVVPPMVSAATGALLVPHAPVGWARVALVLFCYLCFAVTLVASAVLIPLIARRLLRHGPGPAAGVPTLFIVLGPLGQSVTATHNLGALAPGVLPAPYGGALHALALGYGVPVWSLGMVHLVLAGTLVLNTARSGLPFSLTWWSFTFPVGTMVTGTSGLAAATGLVELRTAAALLYLGLATAVVVVLARTLAGVWSGRLLLAPRPVRDGSSPRPAADPA